ncbi:MAG TPA: hypothetical protein VEX37_15275 [Thermomicrobiales bacterium]|nr:hypothetical protein [Thermomicrobiales bacterium]
MRPPAAIQLLLTGMLIALLVCACSGPDNGDPNTPSAIPAMPSLTATEAPATATIVESTASATVPAPSPTHTAAATATATLPPATATATLEPTVAPTPDPRPSSQAIGLPDVDAHYQLDVSELDVASGYVRASEVITIREFRGAVPDWLYLQVVPAEYGFFTLDAASVNGEPTGLETLNGGFTLAHDLPADAVAPYEILLEFQLNVGSEVTGWGVTTLDGDILRLGNWFPIISTDHGYSATLDPSYTAVAEFDVALTLADGVEFAHTGDFISQETTADGRIRYVLHAGNVRDFALAISPSYTIDYGQSASGVSIELYTSGIGEGTRQSILAVAADALDQLSELIGPYPYTTFRIADAGPTMPGGIEYPGLIYINPAYVPLDRLIYHEVAHQWLYAIIGTRTLQDGWIDEGGAEFFERGLPTGFTEVPPLPSGGYAYWLDTSYEDLPDDPNRNWYFSIYEQGAHFYADVKATMGDDAFWAAMREIYANHAFGIATAWDVLSTWQRHSPTDLRPLYHTYFRYDWIDGLTWG